MAMLHKNVLSLYLFVWYSAPGGIEAGPVGAMTPAEFAAKYPECASGTSTANYKYDSHHSKRTTFFGRQGQPELAVANMELCAIQCDAYGHANGHEDLTCVAFNYKVPTQGTGDAPDAAACELVTQAGVDAGLKSETGYYLRKGSTHFSKVETCLKECDTSLHETGNGFFPPLNYAVAFPFEEGAATSCRAAVNARVTQENALTRQEYAAEAAALKLAFAANEVLTPAAFAAKYPPPTCTITSDRKYGGRIAHTTLPTASVELCAILCANAPLCHGINYRQNGANCELVDEGGLAGGVLTGVQTDWQAVPFAQGGTCSTAVIQSATLGLPGPQGPPGHNGAAGHNGVNGTAGANGTDGENGGDSFGVLVIAGLVGGVLGVLLTCAGLLLFRGVIGGGGQGGGGFGKGGMGKGGKGKGKGGQVTLHQW
eukprot:g10712.t1